MSLNIEISKDGYKVLRIDKNDKKIYFGSKYNQKREVEKFLNQMEEVTYKDNFVILGLSFAEHIKELLKLINVESRVLIVEFNHELLEYCKNDKDIKKIIENEKVIIATDKDEVENFIHSYIDGNNVERFKIMGYCGYQKIYEEEAREILKLIRDLIIRIKLNRNTFKKHGELFLNNLISNLEYMAKSNPVNKLKNEYKDKPAIIVSAGPSLSKNIDELKGVDNALILSGGRTLEALLERNIAPSCIGIIDPGEISYKLVEPYIQKVKCPLVMCDMTNEKVVKEHKAEKFFYANIQLIFDAFQQVIDNMYGGGSIAHTLTKLAVYMGCNPIIFIGQDLAYTGEKGYAICSEDRWEEKSYFDRYKSNNDIYVKDIDGNLVRTSLPLNDFRVSLEKIISQNQNVKFINATEGGANIEGTENRKLSDVLGELKNDRIIPMANFYENIDKTQEIIKQLEYNLILIKEYIEICKNAKRILNEYKVSYYSKNQSGLNKSIKKLNELDKRIIEKSHEISLITIGMMKIIFDIENDNEFIVKASDSEIIAFNKEFNRSNELYTKTEEVLVWYHEKIESKIIEMKEVR